MVPSAYTFVNICISLLLSLNLREIENMILMDTRVEYCLRHKKLHYSLTYLFVRAAKRRNNINIVF